MQEMNVCQCRQVNGGKEEWVEQRAQLIGAVSASLGGVGCGLVYAPYKYLDKFGKPQSVLSVSLKALGVACVSASAIYVATYYSSKKALDLFYGAQ